jgi:hypothetical protein
VGTTLGLLVRKAKRDEQPIVRFRQFWGVTKRADLLVSLNLANVDAQYQPVHPERCNRFSFRPSNVHEFYKTWPRLVELCAVSPMNGLMEKRGGALIDIDKGALEHRMRNYYDPNVDWQILMGALRVSYEEEISCPLVARCL